MKFFKLSLVLVSLSFCSSFAQEAEKTKTDTNREVIKTYSQIYNELQQYDKTDQILTEYLSRDGTDGGLWVLLGQTQLKEKKYSQACYAYQKASMLGKSAQEKAFADYSLADCLNQGGRTQESKAILAKLAQTEESFSDSSSQTLALINSGVIRSGGAFPPYQIRARGRLRVSGALGSGFDSNVLLVEESVSGGIPISDRGSFFLTPGAQVGYSGRMFGHSFDSRFIASFTDYLNPAARSFNGLYQRADLLFGTGATHYGVFVDAYFLNRSTFSIYDWEAGLSWQRIIESSSSRIILLDIPLQYQKYINESTLASVNDRTGVDLKVKGTVRWLLGDVEALTVQLNLDGQYTRGLNYRQVGFNLPIQWLKPLPFLSDFGIVNTFSLEAQGTSYLVAQTGRRDLLLKAGAGVMRPIAAGWNSSLDYSYQKNTSNLSSARYTKGIISLQLSHEFL